MPGDPEREEVLEEDAGEDQPAEPEQRIAGRSERVAELDHHVRGDRLMPR